MDAWDINNNLTNLIDEAIVSLGEKEAASAIVEAILNADWDDYDAAAEKIKKNLQNAFWKKETD